jgi:hypothetical protein
MFTFSVRIFLEICSVKHFCYLRRLSRDDCLIQINDVYGLGTISLSTVRRWCIAFISGETTLDGDDRPGRPVNASISICAQRILMDEPFTSARYIAEKLEQPRTAVIKYLREELELRKIKFRWMPHELSEKQSQSGQNVKECFAATGTRRTKMARCHDHNKS